MNLERIRIESVGTTLAGLLYDADSRGRTPIVLTHGFTSSKASMDLLAAYLAGRGYPCLTYDVRGHKLGASTGRLESMDQAVEDLRAVVGDVRQRFGHASIALVGHSMGALLSLAVAADDPEIVAVCSIATGPAPSGAFGSPAGAAMLAQRSPYIDGAEPIELLRQMDSMSDAVERMADRPALFVAAKSDVLVNVEVFRQYAVRAGAGSEFQEIESGHLDAPDRARGVVAKWLDSLTEVA